jgi:hypothetical protein
MKNFSWWQNSLFMACRSFMITLKALGKTAETNILHETKWRIFAV